VESGPFARNPCGRHRPSGRAKLDTRLSSATALSELRPIPKRNFLDLLPTEPLRRHTDRTAYFPEKAIQSSRRHNPEQQQFVIRILKSMPGVFRDEYRSTSLERMTHVVQYESPAPLQNVKSFVHLEMPMDRNPRATHHLLRPQGKIVRACGRTNFDEDAALVAKMNEMFALGKAEHKSLPRCSLPRCGLISLEASRHHRADAKRPQAQHKGSTILLITVHANFPCSIFNSGRCFRRTADHPFQSFSWRTPTEAHFPCSLARVGTTDPLNVRCKTVATDLRGSSATGNAT
jgi:hypothetical protein